MSKSLDDSVGRLLTAMAGVGRDSQSTSLFAVGTVLVGSQDGLKVVCNGQELTAEDIWINPELLEGYSPKLVGILPGSCPDGSTSTHVSEDQLTRGRFGLSAGDRVVLLTLDQQDYYLICKVVRLL